MYDRTEPTGTPLRRGSGVARCAGRSGASRGGSGRRRARSRRHRRAAARDRGPRASVPMSLARASRRSGKRLTSPRPRDRRRARPPEGRDRRARRRGSRRRRSRSHPDAGRPAPRNADAGGHRREAGPGRRPGRVWSIPAGALGHSDEGGATRRQCGESEAAWRERSGLVRTPQILPNPIPTPRFTTPPAASPQIQPGHERDLCGEGDVQEAGMLDESALHS